METGTGNCSLVIRRVAELEEFPGTDITSKEEQKRRLQFQKDDGGWRPYPRSCRDKETKVLSTKGVAEVDFEERVGRELETSGCDID